MEKLTDQDDMVTRAEAARRLGASVRSVDRLIATGQLVAARIPCVGVRVASGSIDRLIAASKLDAQ